MKKLNECEIAQSYVGKTINLTELEKICFNNGDYEDTIEYIAYCCDFDEETLDLFKITPILYETWQYYGIEFCVYIYISNGIVNRCEIFKERQDYSSCCGRYSGGQLLPSQQELRIFRRIMDYITT